jgi:hypothetical protein
MATSRRYGDAPFQQQTTNLVDDCSAPDNPTSRTPCRDCISNCSSVLIGTNHDRRSTSPRRCRR